jgi:pimeloyl-ACP methyl ester carboxylesterase
MFRLTPVVKNLLLINIVVYLLQVTLTSVDLTGFLALHRLGSPDFRPYQFVTYMFAHGGFGHILFNMFGLIFLGPLLEQFWGPKKFIIFYLVTGVGAALIYTGIEVIEANSLKNDVEAYLEAPTADNFAIFVDENSRYFKSTVYEFVDEFGANASNPAFIERSKKEVESYHYTSRVTIPVLMLNGEFDQFFPLETSQIPMFQLLGTPDEDKEHYVAKTGHFVPREILISKHLDWLKKYEK